MLSIILPVYKEPYLNRTINALLANAMGEIEVIPVFDGLVPEEPLPQDERINPVTIEHQGMRGAINAGIAKAQGEWILKIDAHCQVAPGFDRTLVRDCAPEWLMIPRRYRLDDHLWQPINTAYPRDHHYLAYPLPHYLMVPHHYRVPGSGEISDTLSLQGSCWLAHKQTFMQVVGYLDDRPETYGSFAADQLEICLKYWLSGGQVKVNTRTWYAHLYKNPRHYSTGNYAKKPKRLKKHWAWATKHWMADREPGMKHSIFWLIEKFWPLPGWPENWKGDWHEELAHLS